MIHKPKIGLSLAPPCLHRRKHPPTPTEWFFICYVIWTVQYFLYFKTWCIIFLSFFLLFLFVWCRSNVRTVYFWTVWIAVNDTTELFEPKFIHSMYALWAQWHIHVSAIYRTHGTLETLKSPHSKISVQFWFSIPNLHCSIKLRRRVWEKNALKLKRWKKNWKWQPLVFLIPEINDCAYT